MTLNTRPASPPPPTHLTELQTGAVGDRVEENLPLRVEAEACCLVEEDGVVAVTDRDQVVLPGGVVSTALGLELELHGHGEALRYVEVALAAACRLAEVGGGVAGTGDHPAGTVDGHHGQVDGRLLATGTGLENSQPVGRQHTLLSWDLPGAA